MKTLILRSNDLGDQAAMSIANGLNKGTSRLQVLDLSMNSISDAGGEFLALALASNSSLTKLSLRRNNLKNPSGKLFLKSVRENSVIQNLDL
mmetsp:Transcript_32561/g.24064  ORF Transcript_32561/g.24064 Transcript_32561/m.24064 type:complete len:92 (-) Transcript_32561:479-754(-)